MARIEDAPDLFGCGIGVSTIGYFKCEWCGKEYNKDNEDENGDIIDASAPSILHTTFAGKEIGECCFGKIENSVLHRMQDILPWFKRILDSRDKKLQKYKDQLKSIL